MHIALLLASALVGLMVSFSGDFYDSQSKKIAGLSPVGVMTTVGDSVIAFGHCQAMFSLVEHDACERLFGENVVWFVQNEAAP